jgi:hypothetical protein
VKAACVPIRNLHRGDPEIAIVHSRVTRSWRPDDSRWLRISPGGVACKWQLELPLRESLARSMMRAHEPTGINAWTRRRDVRGVGARHDTR